MVVIKVTFNNDIRRITIDESQAFSYKDLRSLLKKIHHNALPTHFEIKYLDDENDKVTISSDRELAEALHFVRTAKQPLLRLVLSEPVKKSTPATAPAPAEADSAKGKEREQPHQQDGAFSPAQLLAVLESALNSPEVQQTWDVVQGTFTTCLDQAVREGRTAAHYVQQHPQFARAQELLTERLPQAIHNDLNTTLPQLLSDIQGIFANLAVPTAPPAPSSSSSSSGSLPVRHHAICDACDSQIVGIRYKCTTCPDYDLCEKCEAKQPSVHDATHYFIKLRSQLPWGLEGNVRLATAPQPQGSTSPLSRASRCPYFQPQQHHQPAQQPQQHHQPAQQPQQPSSDRTGPQFQGPRPGWRKVHPCRFMLSARFISDVSIADGTVLEPNTPFVKIWRLRNDGERAWPEGTTLAYIFGQRLAAVDAVAVPALAAGEEVDIAVEMVAPAEPGHYVSNWRLTGPRGYKFGHRVWVDINVAAEEKPKAEEPKVEAEAAAEPTVEEPASESEEEAFEVLELPKKEEEKKEETVQEPQESSKVVHIVIEEAPAPTTTVPAVVAEEKKEEEEKKPQSPVDDDEPEAVRAVLEQLAQMGFPDRALNKRTLLRNKGNVLATVHKLLGL